MRKTLGIAACILAGSAPLRADFTYTETTQITGGSMLSMMKMAGAFSKQAKQASDPIASTVVVKGNRMARISADHTEIIDLDNETMTNIDSLKKQYTIITFAQMKQQMDAAMAKAKAQQAKSAPSQPEASNTDVKFSVHVRNTDAKKDVAGLNASEAILTMTMDATDKKSGQSGSFAMTNDMWIVPEIPGYDEVREFYKRYAVKMGNVFGGALGQGISPAMLASYRGSGQGMADMAKEMSKMKGVPVLQVMRMGTTADGTPLPAASEGPLPASNGPAMPSAGDVARESAASAISSKLGAFGGLGGFGKKKKEPAPEAPTAGGTPTVAVLLESNTQMTGFSKTADVSRFAVPAGYKQVDPKLSE